jgi:AcrR family transcriptional regulator
VTAPVGNEGAPRRRPGRPRSLEPTAEYLAKLDDIVATAAQVFREKGFDGGSLDDVAARLDVSKASMFHYVKSKRHLLYLIFERALSRGIERVRELSQLDDPWERLAALIRFQVEVVAEDGDSFAVFFDNISPRRTRVDIRGKEIEALAERVRTLEREYFQMFVSAIRDASKSGVLAPVDPIYGAQAILGMTSWVYKWFDPNHHDVEQVVQTCIALIDPTRRAKTTATRATKARAKKVSR